MQDRFKFRCWHKIYKKIYDVYSITPFGVVITSLAVSDKKTHFEDCIIMQCTGLKDHTGKLIYEGDIVKLSYNGGQFTLFGDKFSNNPEPDYFLVEYSDDWQQYFCRQLPLNYSGAIQLENLHMSYEHDLYPKDADVNARRELNHAILVNDDIKFSEVIGNCYENPELLELKA